MHTDGEPLWDIVEEHLDEAEFLWEQWEHGLVAPHYTLSELADGPEERLMAHLDGLVVNGPRVAERLLIPTIADLDAEPTRVRAAALALLQSPGEAGVHAVLAAFHEAPLQRDELARALECSDRPDLLPRISALLTSPDLDLRHSAARIMVFHDASFTDAIPTLLASERTLDRALGLRLAARLPGETRHLHELRASLRSDDPELRDVALGSAALLGLPEAWARARELVQSQDPTAGHALLLLALRGEPADAPLLLAAAEAEATRNAGLWALGFLGTAEAVDATLQWLEDDAHARLAGEALAAITGLDLEDANLTRAAGDDEALEHRPEDDLPLPDPMGVLRWWRENRERFADGRRHLAGNPHTLAAQWAAITAGPMRRRPAHLMALQLQLPAKQRPRLEPRAPTRRQHAELAAWTPPASAG